MKTADEKMAYLHENMLQGIEQALRRGDQKYTGPQSFDSPEHLARKPDVDIQHIHECHVAVRLRDAEDYASMDMIKEALAKIESAIGYLIILHYRVRLHKSV